MDVLARLKAATLASALLTTVCVASMPLRARAQDTAAPLDASVMPTPPSSDSGSYLAPALADPSLAGLDAGVMPTPIVVAPAPAVDTLAPLAAAPAADEAVVDVTVRSARDEGKRLQQSAEAVNVIDTRRAKRETADLGEVLARTQGISIRREGGLGSNARLSLNGLNDDAIRFFLDGVPLDLAGYPFGVANMPVDIVERVEVYRGVVPVRFGADALGGALNLATDQRYETHAIVSYQGGSFGTHRAAAHGRYRHEPTGLIVGATAYFDDADNDYRIDVEIPDERGRLSPARVKRFHDGYRAYNATVELGVVDKPWAKRLIVQGVLSGYDKELQHNIVMKVPYGEINYGETVAGVNARYEVELQRDVELELVAAYARRTIDYQDKSKWVYDWRGARIRERRAPGERDADATDQTNWQDGVYGRALVQWKLATEQTLRVSVSPNFNTRTGDERIQADPNGRDPLEAERKLLTFVSGLEYELNLFGTRLSNIVFVKDYVYRARSEEPLPGGIFRRRDTEEHSAGVGDSLRYRFSPWLYAKASYEYATRLPRPDEVFGDGRLVMANLGLRPEVSHNANIGPRLELRKRWIGTLTADVNGFLRQSDRMIVMLGNDQVFSYQNVYKARSLGVESAVAWVSKKRWVTLDSSVTWQSVRNASDKGTFADFKGDRIPNRPYLFSSWGAQLRFGDLPNEDDSLEPYYHGRYVHEFFRGWESQGLRAFKQVVDAQVVHNVGLSYVFTRELGRFVATFEIQNVSDAMAFDNFGVQRPGRAYTMKIRGEI